MPQAVKRPASPMRQKLSALLLGRFSLVRVMALLLAAHLQERELLKGPTMPLRNPEIPYAIEYNKSYP